MLGLPNPIPNGPLHMGLIKIHMSYTSLGHPSLKRETQPNICWGYPTSVVEEVGDYFISVRESLTF
jgi:hypothetical protein